MHSSEAQHQATDDLVMKIQEVFFQFLQPFLGPAETFIDKKAVANYGTGCTFDQYFMKDAYIEHFQNRDEIFDTGAA